MVRVWPARVQADRREDVETRLDTLDQVREDEARQRDREWDEALQVAGDEDVVYGDGTAGPARLLRDPVEILADKHTGHDAGTGDVDDL